MPYIWFFLALGLMLIWLKLTGRIGMRWIWVLAPLWGPPAVMVGLVAAVQAFH